MNIYFFMRSLAHSLGIVLFFLLANGCYNTQEPQTQQDDKVHQDAGFLKLALACSEGNCDQDALEDAYNKLDDAAIKALASEKEGDLNVTLMLVKAKLEPKVVAVVGKFLNKLESLEKAKVDEQLDHKVGGEDAMAVVRGVHRPSGEDAGERTQVLAYFVSLRPTKTNELKDSSNAFDAAAFKDVMAKVDDADVKAVAEGLDATNRGAMLSWAVAHTTDGQPLFKRIYDKMDPATQQPGLRTGLYDEAYAALATDADALKDMVGALGAGPNEWDLAAHKNELLTHVVGKFYTDGIHAGFSALYGAGAAVDNPEKEIMKNALYVAAAQEPVATIAKVISLYNDLDTAWGLTPGDKTSMLMALVKDYYDHAKHAEFAALRAALVAQARHLKLKMWELAYNADTLVAMHTDLATWGFNGATDAEDFLKESAKTAASKFVTMGASAADKTKAKNNFRSLYEIAGLSQADKNMLHNALFSAAYGTPGVEKAAVQAALAKVGTIVAADFLQHAELVGMNFNPFGDHPNGVKLLYAVLDQASGPNGYSGMPGFSSWDGPFVQAVSAPLKAKIGAGPQWQAYITEAASSHPLADDISTIIKLIRKRVSFSAVVAFGGQVEQEKQVKAWLEF